MITAQDIREKTFEKARIGGYDMAAVDDFLEELADDITASQKENAVLKSKMKVLVDKINEYRQNEEALNMAVLSAQKLAVQIENDARTRAAASIADADRQVQEAVGTISDKTDLEEKRLAAAQKVSAKFFEDMKKLCETQLANMEKITAAFTAKTDALDKAAEAAPVAEAAPAAAPKAPAAPAQAPAAAGFTLDETVRSIEKSVADTKPEPAFNLDFSSEFKMPDTKAPFDFDSTQPFSL